MIFQNKKSFSSFIVFLCVIFFSLGYSVSSEAKTVISGKYEYELDDAGQASNFYYIGDELTVFVPSVIDGFQVDQVSFSGNTSVIDVRIPEGFTSIAHCFAHCTALKNVTLPSTLTCCDGAFTKSGIEEVVLPEGKYSCREMFKDCKSLKTVAGYGDITDSISMFANCTSLASVTIEGTIYGTKAYTFSGCKNLKYVSIRAMSNDALIDGTHTLNDLYQTFRECYSLRELHIPEGAVKLNYICYQDFSLKKVYIPSTVRFLVMPFLECDGLTDVYYAGSKCQWEKISKNLEYDWYYDKLVYEDTTIHYEKGEEHSFGAWTVTQKATCLKDGQKERKCIYCGEKETQVIKAAGHDWGDWKTTKESTAVESGSMERTCKTCGAKETKEIEPLTPKLTLGKKSIKLEKTKKMTLEVVFAKGDTITVQSSDKKIAGVKYKDGKITITAKKKAGKASIVVTTKTGKKATVKVTVPKVKTKKIKCKSIKVKKGKKVQLKPTITPKYSDDKITYSVKDKKIASVSKKGVVKGLKKGTTKITIKSGKKSIKIKVTVK